MAVPGFIVSGTFFGVMAEAGDIAVQGSVSGNLLHSFGTVSTGCFIKSRILAGVNVFLFLAAMICAYYLYSNFIAEYPAWREVKFRVIMLVPSMISECIVWNIRSNRVLKYAVTALRTAAVVYDMRILLQGSRPSAKAMLVLLYSELLAIMLHRRRSKV